MRQWTWHNLNKNGCHQQPARTGVPAAGLLLLLTVGSLAAAAGTQADYDRADRLRERTAHKVFGMSLKPHWFADNTHLWYRWETGPDSRRFRLVDAARGVCEPAFDHARLAEALTDAGVQDLDAERLPLEKLTFDLAADTVTFHLNGTRWRYHRSTHALTHQGAVPEASLPNLYRSGNVPRVSQGGGRSINLAFTNRSNQPVTLCWLDTSGQRQPYGRLDPGGRRRQPTYDGHVWLVTDPNDRTVGVYRAGGDDAQVLIGPDVGDDERGRPQTASPPPRPPRHNSPDGRWSVRIRDFNVHLYETSSGDTFQLTTDGTEANAYTDRFFFSPDSASLAVLRRRKGVDRKVYFVESSPADQLQPRLHAIDYHKPGDTIDIERPYLFNVAERREIPVSNALFDNPFNITDYRWRSDSAEFTFVYNQRGHQVLRVVGLDAATGVARSIIDETSETFICYSQKYFCRPLDATGELLWMSERDGWNHLYLYDAQTGTVKNQITRGAWVVRRVEHVDPETRQIWFTAGGIDPAQDPYHVHLARVRLDGSGLTLLTDGDGTHTVQFSPDRRYLVDTWSRVNRPPVHVLRSAEDGHKICDLGSANWDALLATGWQCPEPFVAKGRDGRTAIYGVIYRPTTFDPNQSYPVIEQIYAGPHDSHVPKHFTPFSPLQTLAELGFILVRIDGMGTSNRSKAFHDVCWKNLADAGLPDRMAWITAAAKQYPFMDITRVGIYGGSAGGQNAAAAVMTHGDFYKVAVADCGCHDNRMDKIWWNEQWMGWPVDDAYAANSNLTRAGRLTGKLFLMVGEMDRNVDPASTLQLVDALIKADKDFDLLVVPGAGHGVAGAAYPARRMADYFVRHLLGVEPRGKSGKDD